VSQLLEIDNSKTLTWKIDNSLENEQLKHKNLENKSLENEECSTWTSPYRP